jgi:hypothetical protein
MSLHLPAYVQIIIAAAVTIAAIIDEITYQRKGQS